GATPFSISTPEGIPRATPNFSFVPRRDGFGVPDRIGTACERSMGFFKDLFTKPQPCAICRLGATGWTRDRTGVISWSIAGMGLDASLLICSTCAKAINSSGLAQKTPLMAIAILASSGIAERPPVHFYLQHPEWRK